MKSNNETGKLKNFKDCFLLLLNFKMMAAKYLI